MTMCHENPTKPAWRTLKCPSCGNDRRFVHAESRYRTRALLLDGGELYWGPGEDRDDYLRPTVYCAVCEDAGRSVVVWPVGEESPACASSAGAGARGDPGPAEEQPGGSAPDLSQRT